VRTVSLPSYAPNQGIQATAASVRSSLGLPLPCVFHV